MKGFIVFKRTVPKTYRHRYIQDPYEVEERHWQCRDHSECPVC